MRVPGEERGIGEELGWEGKICFIDLMGDGRPIVKARTPTFVGYVQGYLGSAPTPSESKPCIVGQRISHDSEDFYQMV